MNIKYQLKEAIRKLGVRYLRYKVGWLSSLTYPPHDDGKCPCGACKYVDMGRGVPGYWLWSGLKVHYCPECAAHLSSCGVIQLMVRMDNQDPVFGTVADLDNGLEAININRELIAMGCKHYWRDDPIDRPYYGIPVFKGDSLREGYPIMETETWLNYLRRIYRFAKKVATEEAPDVS